MMSSWKIEIELGKNRWIFFFQSNFGKSWKYPALKIPTTFSLNLSATILILISVKNGGWLFLCILKARMSLKVDYNNIHSKIRHSKIMLTVKNKSLRHRPIYNFTNVCKNEKNLLKKIFFWINGVKLYYLEQYNWKNHNI